MLKVLIAPGAFKGSLSAGSVALAIAAGAALWDHLLYLELTPLADGGDGTLDALHMALSGQMHEVMISNPQGKPASARWLAAGSLAAAELASACGMAAWAGLKPAPLAAHTFALGQVIADCLSCHYRNIVIAVGGSASTDGGTGALQAMGACFKDKAGMPLPPGGGSLVALAGLDLRGVSRLAGQARFTIAADVQNPLLGETGTARVFAPQKGAGEGDCLLLEQGLTRLADLLEAKTGRILRNCPGSGAGGGTAFGLAAGLNAEIVSGFKWISELLHLKEKIALSHLVVSGEGHLDRQSFMGKTVGELSALCKSLGKPLWVVTAKVEPGLDWKAAGIEQIIVVGEKDKSASFDDIKHKCAQAFNSLLACR